MNAAFFRAWFSKPISDYDFRFAPYTLDSRQRIRDYDRYLDYGRECIAPIVNTYECNKPFINMPAIIRCFLLQNFCLKLPSVGRVGLFTGSLIWNFCMPIVECYHLKQCIANVKDINIKAQQKYQFLTEANVNDFAGEIRFMHKGRDPDNDAVNYYLDSPMNYAALKYYHNEGHIIGLSRELPDMPDSSNTAGEDYSHRIRKTTRRKDLSIPEEYIGSMLPEHRAGPVIPQGSGTRTSITNWGTRLGIPRNSFIWKSTAFNGLIRFIHAPLMYKIVCGMQVVSLLRMLQQISWTQTGSTIRELFVNRQALIGAIGQRSPF